MAGGKIDFDGIASTLLSRAPHLLSSWLPGGKITGREYECGDLSGGPGKSLKVNVDKGVWKDFSTGEGGSDLISLFAAIKGISQGDAAKELGDQPTTEARPKSPPTRPTPKLIPAPKGVGTPGPHPKHGKPAGSWLYVSAASEVLFYVHRYDTPEGKQFCPWSWDGSKWITKGWPAPRPLYNLPDIVGSEKPVMIVEGERSVDAARHLLGSTYVVTTWPNGAAGWKQADWSPLHNRRIIIWPDADEPGFKAAHGIADLLFDHCPEVKVIVHQGQPEGWDAADAVREGWDSKKFYAWAKPFVVTYSRPVNPEPMPDREPAPEPPLPVVSLASLEAELPHKTDRGAVKSTVANLQHILDCLGVVARYNVISKEEEILIPGKSFSMDNKANASLAWITSECAKVRMPIGQISDYLSYIADSNPYNPVATWIQSKPWDGTSRLGNLFATVRARGETVDPAVTTLKTTLIRRWLVSAVAAAFNPNGVSAHGVLVFQGAQYVGKTRWFKKLVPADLQVIADGLLLKPDDRDSVKRVVGYWLVELGELDATFRKSDIAQLKSFLTRDRDVFRKAYAKKESEYARRTVFFASVNPEQFLHDETGNRRFWTIEIESIDHEHTIDMQQVWAEVYDLYKQGESVYLTTDELKLLNTHNENFTTVDPIEERILSDYRWESPALLWRSLTATQIMIELGYDRPNQGDLRRAAAAVKKRNGGLVERTNRGKFLKIPELKLN